MDSCIFCKIAQGDIPVEKLYEDDYVMAFKDINPQAPIHVLLIPKTHYISLLDIGLNNQSSEASLVWEQLRLAIPKVAKILNVDVSGFRTVINTGKDAAQTVPHLHLHLLGGTQLQEHIL